MLELTRNVAERARTAIGVTTQNLAVQDVIALALHAYLFLRVSIAPDSPDAIVARRLSLALFLVTACSLLLARDDNTIRTFDHLLSKSLTRTLYT